MSDLFNRQSLVPSTSQLPFQTFTPDKISFPVGDLYKASYPSSLAHAVRPCLDIRSSSCIIWIRFAALPQLTHPFNLFLLALPCSHNTSPKPPITPISYTLVPWRHDLRSLLLGKLNQLIIVVHPASPVSITSLVISEAAIIRPPAFRCSPTRCIRTRSSLFQLSFGYQTTLMPHG